MEHDEARKPRRRALRLHARTWWSFGSAARTLFSNGEASAAAPPPDMLARVLCGCCRQSAFRDRLSQAQLSARR